MSAKFAEILRCAFTLAMDSFQREFIINPMMKTRIVSDLGMFILFLALMGCSASRGPWPGTSLPKSGVSKEVPALSKGKSEPSFAAAAFQEELNGVLDAELVRAEELRLYQNGESFEPLKKLLKTSQKYFLMNVLAFSCDEVTEPFVQLLEEKAQAGVDVRLITNKGFALLSLPCLRRLEKSGVKVLKVRTHSSYFLNEHKELLIGSQSVAKMFFLADGFNDLDRDMMLYTKGPLATDALRDFISIWTEEISDDKAPDLRPSLAENRNEEFREGLRGEVLQKNLPRQTERLCRFTSERPSLGIKDVQTLWSKLTASSTQEIIFSGVKVDIGEESLGTLLKERSRQGVTVRYLGNGYLSGNGELTMVLTEWIEKLNKSGFSFVAKALQEAREWDRKRLATQTQNEYETLAQNSQVKIYSYFNFIHHKVWSFDSVGSYIGSANVDIDKFNKVYEAGVFCLDRDLNQDLRQQLARDEKNSVPFEK